MVQRKEAKSTDEISSHDVSHDERAYRFAPRPGDVSGEVAEAAASTYDAGNAADQAFLHAHGINASPETLGAMMVEAVRALPRILPGTPRGDLTASEVATLAAGGFDLDGPPPARDPLAESAVAYAALLDDALTTQEAAEQLGVDPSRIRQRLTADPPTLYGVRVGATWRLPKFQFHQGRLIPNIAVVVRALDAELSPLAVHRFMTSPSPDLVAEDDGAERVHCPRDWLLAGLPAARVETAAAAL